MKTAILMIRSFSTFLFLLALCSFSYSQKTGRSIISDHPIDKKISYSRFEKIYLGTINTRAELIKFLKNNIPNLANSDISIQLENRTESRAGVHFVFSQFYKSRKIFRSQIKVNMDKKGNITSFFDFSFHSQNVNGNFSQLENVVQSLEIENLAGHYKKEFLYFPEENKFIAALRLEIAEGDSYFEILYNDIGEVLYQKDLALYHQSQSDSLASAAVFLPDPLTTANVVYGAPYLDQNNSDVNELNAERISATINVIYDTASSVYILENPAVKITEHSLPEILPVTSTTPDFSFTRGQSGFEDVNVFYHISFFNEYLAGLGFTGLVNFQISADAHALSGQDNSNFIVYPTPRLNFGEGGVDDAEDADVIIHEYGHALSHSAAPYSNSGTERNALDEALGDYLASSYSRSINPYLWENVFSWDGHNVFWPGRSSATNDHYPEDLQNNLYEDADIWSSTMMEIWGDIGRENSDALQLQSLYGYSAGMNMKDAARLVVQADSALNGGAFFPQICNRFYNRGLIDLCQLGIQDLQTGNHAELLNTEDFAKGRGNAVLIFENEKNFTVEIFDISGKRLFNRDIKNKAEYQICGKDFNSGMYFIKISSPGFDRNYKLVKF